MGKSGEKGRGSGAGDTRGRNDRGMGMHPVLAQKVVETLGTVCAASAVERFDSDTDNMCRVVKVNPQVFGQFVVVAIMQNDVRFEGVVNQTSRQADWSETPNVPASGFLPSAVRLRLGSPLTRDAYRFSMVWSSQASKARFPLLPCVDHQ